MKLFALIYLFSFQLLFVLSANAQQQVTGYVYEDANRNGKKDRKEQGIAAVSVTNGREVVQTDADGKYALPATDDMIVSVIKPSGYQVALNELNQPQHYYIHKPKGSPENHYPGVSPTGPLPKSVDFPLFSHEESTDFTVLVFGDPQPNVLEDVHSFDKAIVSELLDVESISFGISLGDLVGNALELFAPYSESVAKIGVPWYNVYGNHDMNKGVTDDKMADETFEAHFGPNNYAFNYGNTHFIVLDDVLYPDPTGQYGYMGGFREDILKFVANDLKFVPQDKLVVLAFHIPLQKFEDSYRFLDDHRQKLFDLLEAYPHTLSLSGHTHEQNHHFFTQEEGWNNNKPHHHYNVGTTSGAVYKGPKDTYGTPESPMVDGTPKGYMFLHINDTTYDYEYKVSGHPANYKMSVHVPKIVPKVKKYRGDIVVNFFQGSPKDTLEFRVDDGEWQLMDYEPRLDKYLLYLDHMWDYAEELPWGVRLGAPAPSSHIWSAQMPSSFSLGKHTLEVRAKDWLGRIYTASKEFEMVPTHSDEETQ